jgi:hypothetical protein
MPTEEELIAYCAVVSKTLDILWEDPEFRELFHAEGYDLKQLGKLIYSVFAPAYAHFRENLPPNQRERLFIDARDDLLMQLVQNPAFLIAWQSWSPEYQEDFLNKQTEQPFAELLIRVFPERLKAAYWLAFQEWLQDQDEES